jgi:hypothetical protein
MDDKQLLKVVDQRQSTNLSIQHKISAVIVIAEV